MTGDGRRDLISIVSEMPDGYKLLIQAQRPDGTLSPPEIHTLPEPIFDGCRWLKIGDINGDGIQDPIVVRGRSMFALLSGPNASKTWSMLYSTILGIDAPPTIGDLNNDGHVDIAFHLSNYGLQTIPEGFDFRSRIVMLIGDGEGGFQIREKVTYGQDPHDVERASGFAIGDLNNDGRMDLALGSQRFDYWGQRWDYSVRVYRQTLDSGFGEPIDQSSDPFSLRVVTGDFNADGRTDLGITNDTVEPLKSKISLFQQLASGEISTTPVERAITLYAEDLDVVDLNQDRKPDLLAAHVGARAVGFFLSGSNSLGNETLINFSYGDWFIGETSQAAGDLDGDNCPEVAIAMRYDGLLVTKGSGCQQRIHSMSQPLPARQILNGASTPADELMGTSRTLTSQRASAPLRQRARMTINTPRR